MTKKQAYNLIVFLGAGAFIGLFAKYANMLTFNFEISVFDVFSLIVTAVLAWWVAEKLEKDSDKERCEKEIIIEKLKSVDSLVEKLNSRIEDRVVSLTEITSIINSIDALTNRIIEQIRTRYFSIQLNDNVIYSNELNLLDVLCTDDGDGGMISTIENGTSVCIYTPERKEDISECSNQLSDKIFNMEILVNRA